MLKHFEGLGDKWRALVENPDETVKGLVQTIANEGGTREAWQSHTPDGHTVLMAWPATEPCRAGLIIRGDQNGENYQPVSALPLLEGLENELEVTEVHPWGNDAEGEIAACRAGDDSIWFYDPLLYRDRWSCIVGQKQVFTLSALAYALRPATRDSIQVKGGPQFDSYAKAYVDKNPGVDPASIPPLTLPLKGARIMQQYVNASEYQIRVPVEEVATCQFNGEKVFMLTVSLAGKDDKALRAMLYVAERTLGGFEPKAGDDIEAIVWLQGRLVD
ncbi:hypothetical protein [Nitratidesulfovibrio vulgaris]|jgi:hypothetical protein|uniref:Uncharacterized protein n=2 Tax=Nitratidesulfovibrio vulgaris TaxID=881 RepID=Q72ER8_NITV2|nr:hypothetical protein [Nitratidesulfovibrio vulgaris]GEB80686.1 hypothetical protein DDE01_21010 [Desulfovibrio desulfuricans]AAS94983.1 conserved hypothetical protein [Nitratidesulfovibrio vulgaris str. Hildenborough]ABM29456.1 conserved hypothetical protein [Nitratidesulfovibrio vulgaris DP4]ADP85628.1 hypothetical protein Deval_0459 [Nitratidesulfovibrio vulgaris RCH1]WCB47203.1 hypothetical protein PH214_03730 [Nitratidesulfovibrio vulgaris]